MAIYEPKFPGVNGHGEPCWTVLIECDRERCGTAAEFDFPYAADDHAPTLHAIRRALRAHGWTFEATGPNTCACICPPCDTAAEQDGPEPTAPTSIRRPRPSPYTRTPHQIAMGEAA